MSNWIAHSSYLIGKSHIEKSIPCQDYASTFCNDSLQIIVLSDGCGSSSHSDIGSKIVCETTINILKNDFDNILTMTPLESRDFLLDSINRELDSKALELDVPIKELNATLLFVALKDNESLLMGHLGDGFIGAINGATLEIKSLEKKDDEVNGTVYTTTPNANLFFDLRRGTIKDYKGFILMSDGTGEGLVDSRTPFQKKFINSVAGIFEFAGSNDKKHSIDMINQYVKKVRDHIQSGDDCSIAMLLIENIKISDISVYNVPKPVIKSKQIYDSNSANETYIKLYHYVFDSLNFANIEDINKIVLSNMINSILQNNEITTPNSNPYYELVKLQLKHLIHEGYLNAS